MGEAAFDAAWRSGQTLSLPDAVAEALTVPDMAQGEQPASATSAYGLTTRELEVLRLLVAGRSNPEIANALYISRRTVTTHLTNLFTKLGVSNRVEATVAAQQRGIIAEKAT